MKPNLVTIKSWIKSGALGRQTSWEFRMIVVRRVEELERYCESLEKELGR